jgi:hypothetical protein
MLSTRCFKYDIGRLKVKGKNNILTNINQKKVGLDMLISDKVDFMAKKIIERHIMIKDQFMKNT